MMNSQEFLKQYDNLNNLLFGFAMRLTRNKESAKDLMQEVVCKAFEKRDGFREGTNFKAWMTTIMHNTFLNGYRKKMTRKKVMAPVDDFLFATENLVGTDHPESEIMGKELKGILDDLSDLYSVPFQMFFEGYQYNEIADELSIPMGTVKSRINYARKKLRHAIEVNYGSTARA